MVIMMNRKGQALIEFVMILPVFLLILFVVVDFGIILTHKNNLESISTDIVREIKNGKTIDKLKEEYRDINIKMEDYQNDYEKVIIVDNVHVNTPGLDRILGNPYKISVERIIPKS